MDNHGLLKLLLGGSSLRASEQADFRPLPGKTLVWNGDRFFVSPYIKNQIVLPGSYVFKAFKAFRKRELRQVAVDVTKTFTAAALAEVLGVELARDMRRSRAGRSYCAGLKYNGQQIAKRNRNQKGKERFNLNLISCSTFLRGRLFEYALKMTGVKGVAFPAHPSWISSRRAETILNGIVSVNRDMFADVIREACGNVSDQEVNVLRIRAGKDGWSEILGMPDQLKIKVFPEELSEVGNTLDADGVILVRRASILQSGDFGLVRGLVPMDGKTGIVKGRLLHSPAQASIGPDGKPIPEEFDGWCYDSAIKWIKVDYAGKDSVVLDMTIGLSKIENHEQKEAYRLNLFYMVLGQWDKVTRKDIMALLRKEAFGKTAALNDLRGSMYRHLDMGLSNDEEDVLIDSYLSKYVLGYLPANDPGVIMGLNKRSKALMSANAPSSVYAAIIHRTHVVVDGGHVHKLLPGEFVPSREMRDALQSGFTQFTIRTGEISDFVAGVRYPNTTKGSFLDLRLSEHTLDDVDGVVAVVCLEATVGWQSDCDDHALFLPGYRSMVRATDDFGMIDKSSVPAEGELTPWTACMHGRWCQERTAILVAAYMKCLATVYDFRSDALESAMSDLLPLAQSIQDSVQGIKKYVGLSVGVNEAYELCDTVLGKLLIGDRESPTATVISGKLVGWREGTAESFAQAIRQVYRVELDTDKIFDVAGEFRADNIKAAKPLISAEEREVMLQMWALAHKPMAHVHMVVVDTLLEKIVGTTRKQLHDNPEIIDTLDVSKIERAIVLYAVFVQALVERKEVSNVRGMNGMACLYAERLLG